jgi:hypothetical protein
MRSTQQDQNAEDIELSRNADEDYKEDPPSDFRKDEPVTLKGSVLKTMIDQQVKASMQKHLGVMCTQL